MAKRKKRILFDVMGTGEGPRKQAATERKSARATPAVPPAEVRLSYSMAGTFAVVFLVVVALAYYFGHRQGSQSDRDPAELNRSTPTARAKPARSGGYSIRARRVRFNPYTRREALKELLAQKKLLADHDFRDVRVLEFTKGYAEGEGSLQLWVERAASFEELERLADKVRTLKDREGRTPFKNAYPLKAR